MDDIIKKTINKILSLFHIPKIHPKLYDMEKESEQIALLGEINTENIKPYCDPNEKFIKDCKDLFVNIKKEDIKFYSSGTSSRRSVRFL